MGDLAAWLDVHAAHGAFAVTPRGARCFPCGATYVRQIAAAAPPRRRAAPRARAPIPGLDAPAYAPDVTAELLAAQVSCPRCGWILWIRASRQTKDGYPWWRCRRCNVQQALAAKHRKRHAA